jgi:hypothetical protein
MYSIFLLLVMKWAKLRNPLLFSMGVAIVYNFAFHFYEPALEEH